MRTLKRAYLPREITVNNKIYKRGEKTSKSIRMEVLSSKLKGKLNLHDEPYTPTVHFFNPVATIDLAKDFK